MSKKNSVERMHQIWINGLNNGKIEVTMTKMGALISIDDEIEKQFDTCKELHKYELIHFANWCMVYKSQYPHQNWTIDIFLEKYNETFGNETE